MTYEHPWNTQLRLLESTTKCESELTQKPVKASLGQRRTDLSKNRVGDIAEQYVCILAQWKGAEVFTNIGCDGKTDIVLKIDGNLVEIDVKMAAYLKNGKGIYCWTASAYRVELPVYPVIVEPDGDIMNWRIRWKNSSNSNSQPHCPPGLENFWDKPSTNV